MNFEPLRRLHSKLSIAFVAAAALVLGSCGGGGATSSPVDVGALQLLPGSGSLYAGVPYTFTIAGGRKPYLVTSSEPTLIALNATIDGNSFQIVPRNPGVVDVGLDPNEVPRRTVNIQVRDSVGNSLSNSYNVLQNFFTGYGESYSSTCAAASGGTPPSACSGTDTIITLIPVSNGALYGGRVFQLNKVRGDYQFVVEDPAVTPQLVDQIRVTTDQVGRARVRMRVASGAPTQLATYRVTDVATGVTTDVVVLIVQQPVTDVITLLPATVTFTGTLSTRCGMGTADVMITGGTPPYTVTPIGGLAVSPTTVGASGGVFSVTAPLAAAPCSTNTSVVVTDSRGSITTLTVTIAAGSATAPALAVAPATIASLACGTSSPVTVIGGAGPLSATSSHPRITATLSGTTLTVTRLSPDPLPLGSYPGTATVTVTDGTTISTITVTATPTGGC